MHPAGPVTGLRPPRSDSDQTPEWYSPERAAETVLATDRTRPFGSPISDRSPSPASGTGTTRNA
ncbi:hypothetical protein [Haloterrigena salifodinae]|uniref:Uncharacterized protein n=1 Tax=Haloterrigena salifodinae TaxID=2675099 RepID=A0A8T8E2X8_9EURY|nr:hypothetical protein [Haloterrigena salifodinae]QRV15876.1 hypothetical protein JMJ58_02935 [Haloterrigena salifodinae]